MKKWVVSLLAVGAVAASLVGATQGAIDVREPLQVEIAIDVREPLQVQVAIDVREPYAPTLLAIDVREPYELTIKA